MFEVVLQIVVELVLQLVAELATELGLEGLARWAGRSRSTHPAWAALAYAALGALIGGLSLIWFPALFIRTPVWQAVNLVVTPVVAGVVMAFVGQARSRHRGAHTHLSTFASGYGFAVGMGLVRYLALGVFK